MPRTLNYFDVTNIIPGDEAVSSLDFPDINQERLELYAAVAKMVESETDGKWYFCSTEHGPTLMFPLFNFHIGHGGVFGDSYISNDSHVKNVFKSGAEELIHKIFRSHAIQQEISDLIKKLVNEGLTKNLVYIYDPINGGTSFVPSPGIPIFKH